MAAEAVWPRVGCGAAIVSDGKLLLVRRRRSPEAGCWGLPGGKVEPFETLADATVREIREELGIVITPAALLCVVDQVADGQHWVAPVFRVEHFDGTPSILEPDALADMGWFGLDDLPAPLTEATRQAMAAMGPRSG